MDKYGIDVYEYTKEYHVNEITMIILESGRFIFLDKSVVTDMYLPSKHLAITNRNRHETYSTVKEIYNLKENQLSDKFELIKHHYGKKWISGRGYGTRSVNHFNKNMEELFKDNMDFIPEVSDCPQK